MKNLKSLALQYFNGELLVLDQTALPHEEKWIKVESPDHMIGLIQRLAIRGAPLIGVGAALALGQFAKSGASRAALKEAAQKLRAARPTAVNLMAAMDRCLQNLDRIPETAEAIFEEDVRLCEEMTSRAAALIQNGDRLLTHCNSGGLATAGLGTALGAIIKAHQQCKNIHVYVDETRPLLQGARLTTWELKKHGVPYTLICDNMAGFLMSQDKIHRVFVGADRIAKNGDFANKIGTYSLAVLAHHHHIPFYVVAPQTTVDLRCPSGKEIPIEQREAPEVRTTRAPADAPVYNPAFDVTPRSLITQIILDHGTM